VTTTSPGETVRRPDHVVRDPDLDDDRDASVEPAMRSRRPVRGADLGLVACETCELVMRAPANVDGKCPRCGDDVGCDPWTSSRAWAFLIAAAILYIPANTFPIMHTEQFPLRRDDTILSGAGYLWDQGSWDLAVLVFAASICVPLVKIVALGLLLVTSRRPSTWRQRGRTTLYRVLEVIGHWSMLDVFVVSLLTAMVQLGRFAQIEPGPAVLPFAAVVVLTMLASASFDPRSIWTAPPEPEAKLDGHEGDGFGGRERRPVPEVQPS